MKSTRFFLFAILLIAFVAVLVSCDMITGLLDGDTTAGGDATTTTTAVTTTVTAAITLPPLTSEGGIKSVREAFGEGLRVTYGSGKTQNLGTVDVHETYTVTYLPAVLKYLEKNVGRNDNESCHDEDITEAYIRFNRTIRFSRNGSFTIYQENTAQKDLDKFYSFGVISGTFSNPTYMYVPASENLATPTVRPNQGEAFNVLGDPLLVRDYYQLTDPHGTKAMGIGYYPFFGIATDAVRQEMVNPGDSQGNKVGQFSHISKNYPPLIRADVLRAGESFSYIGYHTPTIPIDDDFFVVNWYFVGDEVMLLINADKAVAEKTVALPEYLDGMRVEVTQKSDSFTVSSTAIDGGVTVSTTGAGYAILRLTPAE